MEPTICARCLHSSDWHRLDDSKNVGPTDPAAEFRCYGYDVEQPGPPHPPGELCSCPDFVTENPFDEHTRMWADEITGAA